MFITGGIILVKVYQNRHPHVQANAFIAFFAFAVIIFFTVIGIVSAHAIKVIEFKVLLFLFSVCISLSFALSLSLFPSPFHYVFLLHSIMTAITQLL